MAFAELRYQGWPDNTVFSLRLFVSRGGQALDGDVQLKLTKNANQADVLENIGINGVPLVAQAQGGAVWNSPAIDYSQAARNGYDLLLAVYNNTVVGRKPLPNRNRAGNNAQGQQDNASYELKFECSATDHKAVPVKDADGKVTSYNVPLSIAVTKTENKKKKPAKRVRFRLYRDTIQVGPADGWETNDDGHARQTVSNVVPGGIDNCGVVQIKCRVIELPRHPQTDDLILAEKSITVEVPHVEEARTARTLTAHTTEPIKEAKKHTHRITLVAEDQKKKAMGVGLVSWECGSLNAVVDCSQGYVSFDVEITKPGQHTFIARSETAKLVSNTLTLSGPPERKAKLTIEESKATHWKNLTVFYGEGDSPVSATLEVWPTNGCRIAVRASGQSEWKIKAGKIKLPTTGRSVLQVRIDRLGPNVAGDDVFVGVEGNPSAQSGPHYVSGRL